MREKGELGQIKKGRVDLAQEFSKSNKREDGLNSISAHALLEG